MAGNGAKRKRGFARLDPEQQREIARKGGQAVSQDRAHMSKIGHRGAVSPRRQRVKAKD